MDLCKRRQVMTSIILSRPSLKLRTHPSALITPLRSLIQKLDEKNRYAKKNSEPFSVPYFIRPHLNVPIHIYEDASTSCRSSLPSLEEHRRCATGTRPSDLLRSVHEFDAPPDTASVIYHRTAFACCRICNAAPITVSGGVCETCRSRDPFVEPSETQNTDVITETPNELHAGWQTSTGIRW